MISLLVIVRCLVLGVVPCAAPEDGNKDPVEVDFAPLPLAGPIDCALHYTFTSHGDTGVTGVMHVTKETPSEVRDYLKKSLEEEGWVVKAEGKTKLIIYAQGKHLPRKVEFKVDTFERKIEGNITPTVKRLKKA